MGRIVHVFIVVGLVCGLVAIDARGSATQAKPAPPQCIRIGVVNPSVSDRVFVPFGGVCEPGWERVNSDGRRLWWLLLSLVSPFALFFATAYTLGRGVLNRGWNANDTRKVVGIIMLVLPPLLPMLPFVSGSANFTFALLGYVLFLLALLVFIAPMRRRSHIVATAFASLDRPEDRPFTLLWLVSAYIVSATIFFVAALGVLRVHPVLLVAVVLAITVGDIVAGVVGRHFGRHTYATIGLGTSRGYVRSLEGSAAMLAAATVVIAFVTMGLPADLRVWSLLILPLTLTLAEALLSPHTWDEPIMYAAGVAGCVAVQMLAG